MTLQIEKPGKRTEYILKADRESNEQTKFMLRAITWEEMSEAGEQTALTVDQITQIQGITAKAREEGRELNTEEIDQVSAVMPANAESIRRMLQQHSTAVRYGLAEIKNLVDTDGQPLVVTAAEFARIAPQSVLLELGTEIMRLSRHSEAAIKK